MKVLKCINGVTLTELVVVMAVISVLASVTMPLLRVSVKRGKEMELRRDLRMMRDGIDAYKKLYDYRQIPQSAGESGYPKTLEDLTKVITLSNTLATLPSPAPGGAATAPAVAQPQKIRILRKIPVDPMTGNTEWGMRSNSDEPDSSVWGGQDVFDVYSLSDGTALDGTKYKDW